jgi:tetratricopeptide (TPR) repeat protein
MAMRNTLKILILAFLLQALLGSCARNHSPFSQNTSPLHFKELQSIEALLETQPEVALDSLNLLKERLHGKSITPLDANELLLLEVQAHYKNRCLSEHSPDLTSVIAFYDSLVLLFPTDAELRYLLANTYYYKGVECAFADDDVDAFSHYLDALSQMDSRNDWTEQPFAQRFIALTYTRLSEILYRYGFYEEAMTNCRNAAEHFEKNADLAAMMRYEAAIYQAEKAYDKALARYAEAETLAPVGEEAVQLSVGAKLFELHQYDSAYPHLKRAFANGDHIARVDAAAKLAEICRDKGLDEEELRYTRYYVENSLRESRQASKKMEIEYLYDSFNSPDTTETTDRETNNSLIILLLLLLIAVIGFLAFIIVRNRSRISHIENQISDIKEKHKQENADKDLEISQMARQLDDTRERLENVTNHTFEEAWRGFNESNIALKINRMMEGNDIMIKNVGLFPKLKLKEVDFIDLVRTVNANFTDCSQRFLKDYPELNTADFRQCCLAMLGMNDAQIAVLEGISYSGVNRRTKKILSALGSDTTLEQAILSYLRNNW